MGFKNSVEVREYLVRALRLDLVGPGVDGEYSEEMLPGRVRPSNWYVTGFLIPSGTPPELRADADKDDSIGETPAGRLEEESSEDRSPAKKGFFPSSIGLSFLVSSEADQLTVTVRWGDYSKLDHQEGDKKPEKVWQRLPQERVVDLALPDTTSDGINHAVPDSGGLNLHLAVRPIDTSLIAGLPPGTRAVSVFLVNNRDASAHGVDNAGGSGGLESLYIFQAEIEVTSERPLVPRPDPRGSRPPVGSTAKGSDDRQSGSADGQDWDNRVADLHYSDVPEYASGHGLAAAWDLTEGKCHTVRTTWIPDATVAKTETAPVAGVELSMWELGMLPDGATLRDALSPLVEHYRDWINQQHHEIAHFDRGRLEVAEELLRRAKWSATRIQAGIQVLASDPDALDAFRVANRAVANALHRRTVGVIAPPRSDVPQWRAFQLAFILINIAGLTDRQHPERRIVDLLFFPTGGGKTEAYLGLAAYTIVLRRLKHRRDDSLAGAGVAVIMRYTLRLLTLDQLARAASLICALELERQRDPDRYGQWPIEIGLWVGKAATPNVMGRKGDSRPDTARSKTRQYKADSSKPLPIPLATCPWCETAFEPASFTLRPNDDAPSELRIVCTNFECDFSGDRPLPILAVDEAIYRRLPAFLIATVDKFASLPFTAETGVLLGGADRVDAEGFYGAATPRRGKPLSNPLTGPDLVIQDELHLISGPLGTMTGLYETAIEALCMRTPSDGHARPGHTTESGSGIADITGALPKIVASTATVRQAEEQILALFGRSLTQVFPPPGPTRDDSFFAHVKSIDEVPGRLYLGIAAPGRSAKVLMQRVWLALFCAAERAFRDSGGRRNTDNPADPYMTVLGYFNSLRELGGARRILEEQVHHSARSHGGRTRVGERMGLFSDRTSFADVVELTSRVPTNKVAEARDRLGRSAHEPNHVDSAIATNMISVGLDITRLGLMVVLGQPKTHAEYIQATSRVGRDDARPGLVVTLLNVHRPRDRSHYERFRHYHETFYRSVEASSVTPFSARALDRGLAGASVALARHVEPMLTSPRGVENLAAFRTDIEQVLIDTFTRRIDSQEMSEDERAERLQSVRSRLVGLLDSWITVVDGYHQVNAKVQYQKHELKGPQPLLREGLEEEFESPHHEKFQANRSLRDVEPEVQLYVKPLSASVGTDR